VSVKRAITRETDIKIKIYIKKHLHPHDDMGEVSAFCMSAYTLRTAKKVRMCFFLFAKIEDEKDHLQNRGHDPRKGIGEIKTSDIVRCFAVAKKRIDHVDPKKS